MKTIRLWLLILLAVLHPVRGVVAATMPCAAGGSGAATAMQSHGHAAGHHAQSGDSQDGPHAHHDHAAVQHDNGHVPADTQADKCTLCSACCSATPLMSSMPSVGAPQNLAAADFPAVPAPSPCFLSDGQERPPRSI